MDSPNLDSGKLSENVLSEQEVIDAPEDDYMNADQLEFFRQKLIELHDTTRARIQEAKDQMTSPNNTSDENDRASYEELAAISLRIVDREQKLLPKIQQALERIRKGTYGFCKETEEPIGIKRLLARPTADYCAEVKALKEIEEKAYRH